MTQAVNPQEFENSVKNFSNQRAGLLSELLFDTLNLNSDDFKIIIKLGAVYVNNERQLRDKLISENNLIRVHTKPRRFDCNFKWESLIIYENDFCLILNKPSGIPSHPLIDNVIENSLTQTSRSRNYPLYITHRLDTLTSGLIVYAKKQQFVKSFNIQLQERSIKKKYVALVENTQIFPKKLVHYMEPTARTPKKVSPHFNEDWPICELEILEQKIISPDLSWIKINLLTGRTHQIRAQLSHLQSPINGDLLYGSQLVFQKNAIALKSCEVEFNCGDERMHFSLNEEFNIF